MAFQQGLSGLNSSSKALDAISNNIANASTVGYKASGVQFADVYAASLGVGGASQIGIGTSIAAVQQQFSQGNISTSNNPLDIAINGSGFFQLYNSPADKTSTYTRNGQFHVDQSGYIVNAQLRNLTGYAITQGGAPGGDPIPVKLDTTGVVPLTTGGAEFQPGIFTQINFDDRDEKSLASAGTDQINPWTSNSKFPPDDLGTYNFSTAVTIYDQKGNDHSLSMYFTRLDNSAGNPVEKNLVQMHFVLDNVDITSAVVDANGFNAGTVPTLKFNETGLIDTDTAGDTATDPNNFISSKFEIDESILAGLLNDPLDPASGTPFANLFLPTGIPMDFGGSTLFGSGYDVNKMVQDGYPYGRLSGVTVSPEGVLRGNYSNGQTKDIAQIILADFASATGLSSLGNNQWAATSASGPALIGVPGAGSRGFLQAASVEDSNVDLTQELVNMITQQRNYQANAQSIKTQDQVMQTLVNLR